MVIFKTNINSYLFLLLLSIIVFLSSCQAKRFLKEDETFLHKNTIKFDSEYKIEDKIFLNQELSTLLEQKPNESILGISRQWFHYVYLNKNSKFSKWVKKTFAQPPSIFKKELTEQTASTFEKFLKNNRGFYNAKVDYKVYSSGRVSILNYIFPKNKKQNYITDVDYIIKTGKRYNLDKITYECDDKSILKIINEASNNSYLNAGNPVNSSDYSREKIRLTNLLQNRGYALFNQNFIELFGDSSNYKVDLIVRINNTTDNLNHKVFSIGKVEVFTDYYPSQTINDLDSVHFNNIIFHKELEKHLVRPDVLFGAITVLPGQLYKKNKNRETYNKLTKFRIYRFVSIKTEIDSKNDSIINYKIRLYTHESKHHRDHEMNLNYGTFSESGSYLEVEASSTFYNRKLSSRGDNISLSASGDIKINILDRDYSEFNLIGKINYVNPNSPNTMKVSPLYLYASLLKNINYNSLKNNTNTSASISYQYQTIINNLNISSFNFSYGYNYSPNKNINVLSNQIGINYYAPTILNDSLYSTFQKKSMDNVFITGLILKNIAFNYASKPKQSLYNYKLLFGFETSGTEVFLANKTYNFLSKKDEIWKPSEKISYAKFLKVHLEYRPKYSLGTSTELAGRIYAGIGVPFGDSDVLPYIKQFEVGGPNSMRAWTARELGPGSYIHTSDINKEFPYQKGDMRLEANLEYRFKISHLFKSAVFIDAGNIWTLKYDKEREGSQLDKDFYKAIAVDAGVSIQLDIPILLRLDLAYKLRNPYQNNDMNYWEFDLSKPSVVFAIDHPF